MPFPQRVIETRTDIEDVFQENTQNILQKTAVSNMIGVLEQLNKISLYASEIFSDILTTTESNNNRIKTIKTRISSIEKRVEPTEQLFKSQAPSYFYDNPYTGKEWQRKDPLRGLLFRRDRANKFVNRRREIGLPLPDLSAMDKISVSGPCIKKYSDSNFFMNEWLEAEKKKMEEEKAKRRERKKKRKKRKRQGAEKITGIEKWVYDPITGKKVKMKAKEITVTKYELIDSNAGNIDFESSDKASSDRISGFGTSKVAQMANKKEKTKKQQKAAKKQQHVSNLSPNTSHQAGGPSYGPGSIPDIQQIQQQQPPPNPVAKPPPNPVIAGGGPPPNPVAAAGGPPPIPGAAAAAVPPPVPGANGGGAPPPNPMQSGGPPPVPVKKKLTAAEMAARSAQQAESSGAYRPPTAPSNAAAAPAQKPPPMVPVASNALLAGIRGGVQLKKATVVKRKPKMDKRDMLLSAIQKKGGGGLRKVADSEKNVKREEEKDQTIFAILNRRQYMADDSDSDSGSSWSDDD